MFHCLGANITANFQQTSDFVLRFDLGMIFLVPRLVAGPHFLVPRFVPGLPFLMPRFVSGLHFLVPTFTRNFYNKLFVWVNMKVSKIFHMVLVVNRHILKIFLLNLRRKSANNFDKICARFLYMIMQE